MVCKYCDDGDGNSVFPYYGLATHTHDTKNGIIGSTRISPKNEWPDNFKEDESAAGCGIYLYCPECGEGK